MKKRLLLLSLSLLTPAMFDAQVDVDKPINLSGSNDSDRAITNLAAPIDGTDAANKD